MKKAYLFFVFVFIISSIISCSGGDDSGSSDNNQQIIPTNLEVNITVQGQDSQNPNGDGSGVFYGTVTAVDADYFTFKIGSEDESEPSQSGDFTYTKTGSGIEQFPFYVYAYSSTGNKISKITNLSILVEDGGNSGSGNNDVLVWSDEFEGTGSIDTSKWTTETGGGGWGNQEEQIYTSSSSNLRKEGGILKIKVQKESNGGFTSARIKTQDKFEFQYGRVDIRAKLPSVQGSWPALWMLGANWPEPGVGWPRCGEIDIMEQFENKNIITSTIHWFNQDNVDINGTGQASHGGDISASTYVSLYNAQLDVAPISSVSFSEEFHVYSLNWTQNGLHFYIDGFHFFSTGNNNSLPFNQDFFLIFNVAMGGTNGGTIDPNLQEGYVDAMEVDYVRVYQ